jgi:hypothetical protein
MKEIEITEEQVREERLRAVDRRSHWLYLAVVLGGSIALMLALIALLDAAA